MTLMDCIKKARNTGYTTVIFCEDLFDGGKYKLNKIKLLIPSKNNYVFIPDKKEIWVENEKHKLIKKCATIS